MLRGLLLLLILRIGALSTQAQPAPTAPLDTAGLTAALQHHWQQSNFPGFAVAIISPDGIVYEHGFGYANTARRTPYTPATVQCVGSVSKTLLGIALLQAAAAGQLSLEQPVNELLPFSVRNPYYPEQPITLRHLATMTAGLTDAQRFYNAHAYTKGTTASITNEEYLRRTLNPGGKWYSRRRFLPHAPGTYYAYSNEAAALAALALEKATGQPYDQFTRQHILLPLGMTDSGWAYADVDSARLATLYDARGRVVAPYTTVTYPDGGLLTSVHSAARYLHGILDPTSAGAPLSAALRDSLVRPQFTAAHPPLHVYPAEPNQGLFWAHRRNGTIGHTGGDAGLTSFLFFDPVTRVGKIFLTNTQVQPGPRNLAQFVAIWKLLDMLP